jgi:hypothetical protein
MFTTIPARSHGSRATARLVASDRWSTGADVAAAPGGACHRDSRANSTADPSRSPPAALGVAMP